jgi:hypothetical protein
VLGDDARDDTVGRHLCLPPFVPAQHRERHAR